MHALTEIEVTAIVGPDQKRPFSTLRRFAQESAAAAEASLQRCELCSEPIAQEHRHLLEVTTREIACVCRACSILFDKEAASMGKYRLVPDRRLFLEGFQMSDSQWEGLWIPVGIAFMFYSTPAQEVAAYYPSPAGPTQSLLKLETWQELEERNPVLKEMQRDVEALLVNRARGARQHFLVPIDKCYSLVGLIRIHWRGLSGGQEVWKEIERFFESLQRRSRVHA
jgi:hypothetical protein